MLNVSASLIRFWETEFDILKPKKNRQGNRLFTDEDIKNLKVIHHLVRERGFTLEGAKKKLKESKETTLRNTEVVESLKKLRGFLVEVKNSLEVGGAATEVQDAVELKHTPEVKESSEESNSSEAENSLEVKDSQ